MNQYHPHMHVHRHRHSQQQQQQPEFYSGQWTKEEQEYVTCLVDGFKNGTLDIPDGTSLRFFIAAKLGCKPKRVSKKYERSGYNGKQVYRRDTNVPTKDLEAYRQRLKDCEKAFKESRALVVSMQEAKTDGNKGGGHSSRSAVVTETPVISLRSAPTGATQAALEDRLLAMRNQIDRRTTNMLTANQATTAYHNNAMANMMAAGGAGVGSGMGMNMNMNSGTNPDVLQAMMYQRQQQRAAALGGLGGSPTNPHHGMAGAGGGFPGAGAGGGPTTNKLLIDLYQRRQQLIMSRAAAAGASSPSFMMEGGPADHMMMNLRAGGSSGSVSPTNFNFAAGMIGGGMIGGEYTKRDLEDLEAAEERARKRARAA